MSTLRTFTNFCLIESAYVQLRMWTCWLWHFILNKCADVCEMEIMMKLLIWKLLSQSLQRCILGNKPVPVHQFAWNSLFWVLTCTHLSLFYMDYRLPVIQSLEADVRQTTQSLLAQILQRLRSNIQVRLKFQKWTSEAAEPFWTLCSLPTAHHYRIDRIHAISIDCFVTSVLFWMLCIFLQLPECLRVIGYLRRLAVFNEQEIRLQVQSALIGFHL